jgi:hypothetical protein
MHVIEIGSYGNFEYGVDQDTLVLYRRHTDPCCHLIYTNGSMEWRIAKHVPNVIEKEYYNLRDYMEGHGYDK